MEVILEIAEVFGDTKSVKMFALWLVSVNSWLGGKRPIDMLESDPERVLHAARIEKQGILHG